MIVLDANVLLSATLGTRTKRVLAEAVERGLALAVAEPQMFEAERVLIAKLSMWREEAQLALEVVTSGMVIVGPSFYAAQEEAARQRLHPRAQPDWPVLAAALTFAGGIWSHDRDLFGTGIAVWSTRNIRYAT